MGLGLDRQQIRYSGLSTGLIKIGTDSDDPETLFTDNADGTIDINLTGRYRVVDRVNDANGAPANNQFNKSRSRMFTWATESNKDFTSLPDGNIVIIADDTEAVSMVELSNQQGLLPVFDAGPNQNTHVQIGTFIKVGSLIQVGTLLTNYQLNNNPYNKIKNIGLVQGTINSLDATIVVSAVVGTLSISTSAGRAFVGSDAGFIQTAGLNPSQFTIAATSPTLILRVVRDDTIDSQATTLDVANVELSFGILTLLGNSKAANTFIMAFGTFNAQLYGQVEYSTGAALALAAAAKEDPDIPNIAIFGGKIVTISFDQGITDLDPAAGGTIFTPMKQYR